MNKLKRITLSGFRSIKTMDIDLRFLNILIGANEAGKSNLISFFKMLNEMMAGRFQQYIAICGRAQSLLHFGSRITSQIKAKLAFESENGTETYCLCLAHAAGDTLIFTEETLSLPQPSPKVEQLGAGHLETKISETAKDMPASGTLRYLIERCRVYHFHDTSSVAGVRQSCYVGNNKWLMPDAGNLAALLLKFRKENNSSYQRIVRTVRLIAPFFDDFELEPDGSDRVILNWREKGADRIFGPHQFSDGTLRAICLITLLLQPEDNMPELIIADEPEIGLHPYALNVTAALFKNASQHTQILISTQSGSFLDNFAPEDVIVVNREDKASQFKRLSPSELEVWLDEYSLGEVVVNREDKASQFKRLSPSELEVWLDEYSLGEV